MKKILLIALIAASFSPMAFADRDRLEHRQDYQHRSHPDARWHSDAGWFRPEIIGEVFVYGSTL
jgi:hypothetical protein